jgi:hypothetical protein
VQPGDARDALGQFRSTQHPAGLVLKLDIVVLLGPVISDEQHFSLHSIVARVTMRSLRENHQRPNKQVLTPMIGGHDIPSAVWAPDHQQGHGLDIGLQASWVRECSPAGGYRIRV